MTDPELLNKLVTEYNNDDNIFYQCYKHSLINSDSLIKTFKQCTRDLQKLSDISYDFNMLITLSKQMNITKRDIRQLCEILSSMLGTTITQICSQDRELIITEPVAFENYCPYPRAEVVLYCTSSLASRIDTIIEYNGYRYKLVEVRPEDTPYYYINCHLLEKI